ncbi:phosphoribosylanthranilate isomerase [Desulfacinum hydrothermale DSM 13146]|uniref:N-(5'-phosphoribosyl)anthranilate isomerase n=1 Tax=Desulfacinum hydrothermale DSM 13146 TaxID=1121390 RepID=A0A1W1XTC1_9BACT|nr:phosphoribosylanthranilate isomerase [Desulfacinum hydrothermale]SMC26778.1 phosphoribosylanthranilate isomerase [Desulfacinum hydrothermale DSM 13146]
MEIKICGITRREDARFAASLGVDAVGFVFYAKSPRYVDGEAARELAAQLPESVAKVGVFVDEPAERVAEIARLVGLTHVQLHGGESPEEVDILKSEGLGVIKALFVNRAPGLDDQRRYHPAAFLVECAGRSRPGGNALAWDWASVKGRVQHRPFILAGGLDPANVESAVRAARPQAVDVSSGVEARPGVKDARKMEEFVNAVRRMEPSAAQGRIFS